MFWWLLLSLSFSSTEALHRPVTSTGTVHFLVDYARFERQDSLFQVEVYYLLDPSGLGNASSYEVQVKLEREGAKPSTSNWQKKLQPGHQGQVVDYFQLYLRPGTYRLQVVLKAGQAQGQADLTLQVPPPGTGLRCSDIELALDLVRDSLNPFYKHGVAVIPNPSWTYRPPNQHLAYYVEFYGLTPDTGYLVLNQVVQDTAGTPVLRVKPHLIAKNRRRSAPWAGSLALSALAPGLYNLRLQIIDLSTGQRAEALHPFFWNPPALQVPEVDSTTLAYLSFIDYFASEKDMAELRSLHDSQGRTLFLLKFWKRFDPDPDTPENEFLPEFIRRVRYADEHFTEGRKLGRYTDRGRIYIKYGPPDQIERKSLAFGERDSEKWIYYQRGTMEFVFVDLQGNNVYELVYSSIPEEPSRPDWRRILRQDEGGFDF